MLIRDQQEITPFLKGDKYRQGHKASVIGVLGKDAPDVYSRGALFYNADRWTVRFFIGIMCEWAQKNPGCVPTRKEVAEWVNRSNSMAAPHREIVIANTPDLLPIRTAMALTGGAYHEAFHTKYSERGTLQTQTMADIVLPRWAKVKDWAPLTMALLEWSNIIDDTRIERRGREDYEGSYVKLCDLQDYILTKEKEGFENAKSHGKKAGAGTLSIITRCFRDLGLGYNTEIQREAAATYRKDNNEAVEMVVSGPLRPLVEENIRMTREDTVGCLRLAMDVLIALGDLADKNESDQENQQQGPGDGETQCPQCHAPGNKLIVRPKSDGRGGKVKGKGIVTCTVCGWQQEINVQIKKVPSQGAGQQPDPKNTPQIQGFDESDIEDDGDSQSSQGGQGGKSGKDKKDGKDKNSGKSGKSGKDKKDGDDEGDSGKSGKDDDSKDKKDGDGAGKDEDEGDEGQEQKTGAGKGEDEGDEGSEDGDQDGDQDGSGDDGEDPEGDEGSEGDDQQDGDGGLGNQGPEGVTDSGENSGGQAGNSGGYHYDPNPVPGTDWSQVAENYIEDAESGKKSGIKDNNSALQEGFEEAQTKEDRNTKKTEVPWRPYDPGSDEALMVQPSQKGQEYDRNQADSLLASVKKESAFLRARLRSVVRSLEMTSTYHGVPKGKGLSSRFLVDSKVALKGGERPDRAYYKKGVQVDMTMAAAVVVDESGSMNNLRKLATQMMCAIVEPLDGLNCPTLAIGFRNGHGGGYPSSEDKGKYHRFHGVTYDIFKMWHEKFKTIRWRFANTRATGGTPMSDGVQYALNGLSRRDEHHRFMFVITDGCPDGGHEEVIRRQVRLAKEAGIHIIGVGVGSGTEYVKKLFPDHVQSDHINEIPKMLIAKLNELADIRGGRQGIRVKGD